MKNIFYLLIVLICFSCSNDDNQDITTEIPDIPINKSPESFSLLKVENNSSDVELKPLFTWNPAQDPENDAVTYNLYLDTITPPSKIHSQNLVQTSIEINDNLELSKTYYWNIVATDSKNNSTESATYTFNSIDLKFPEQAVTDNPGWEERREHGTLVFDNKIWIIAGSNGSRFNDVWNTIDGENWQLVNSEADFSARNGATYLVHKNKMWVIGGDTGFGVNDIWSSPDGQIWTEVADSAPFDEGTNKTGVVFDDKIWVIGQKSFEVGSLPVYGIWNSNDGLQWSEIPNNLPLGTIRPNSSWSYNGKIWVVTIGFGEFADTAIWNSPDGQNWTRITQPNEIPNKSLNSIVVYDNKFWLIGGKSPNSYHNDIWFSRDGSEWHNITQEGPFGKRAYMGCVSFNEKLWVIGGARLFPTEERIYFNDVWSFSKENN